MTPDDAWILTYTGRQFWPLNPRIEDVCLEDIAHALSLLCRFTGHVHQFYSVAQHCVHASYLVPPRHALAALLHDASEAYLCDIARPVKQSDLFAPYREAERRLEEVIYERYGVDTIDLRAVQAADEILLQTERRDLMPRGHWRIDHTKCLYDTIRPESPLEAEQAFLVRFKEVNSLV